jgi:ribosome-associated translation inhibitor RaiA
MQVLVNTDSAIHGSQALHASVEATVVETLGRFGEQLTTVQVHISDANSHKQGEGDKECMMEARLAGLKRIVVSHAANTVDEAVDGAAEKLERTIDRTLGRIGNPKGNMPIGGPPGV